MESFALVYTMRLVLKKISAVLQDRLYTLESDV